MKPTREQILNEPAGRQMDEWVAEYVMGWELSPPLGHDPTTKITYMVGEPPDIAFVEIFMPSKKMESAWDVVEKLKELGFSIIRLSTGDMMGDLWQCHIADAYREIANPGDKDYYANAETPSLAICKAALLAVIDSISTDVEGAN